MHCVRRAKNLIMREQFEWFNIWRYYIPTLTYINDSFSAQQSPTTHKKKKQLVNSYEFNWREKNCSILIKTPYNLPFNEITDKITSKTMR